jgi:hypothetical protein
VADDPAGAEVRDVVVAEAEVADDEDDDEVDGDVVAAAREVPGDAEASTRDAARMPRPTAAAADTVHAAPSAMCRFMGQSLRRAPLSAPQDQVKPWRSARRVPTGRSGRCGAVRR